MSAVAIGAAVLPYAPPRVWATIAVCAIIPDLDAIGRPFGRADIAWLGGHRALTHSLTASAALGLAAALFLRREPGAPGTFARLWLGLFVAAGSHAALDAFTGYGEGVAFLAPWSWARYRAPWPVLSGLWSDFALFVVAAVVARVVIERRGWRVPRALAWGG